MPKFEEGASFDAQVEHILRFCLGPDFRIDQTTRSKYQSPEYASPEEDAVQVWREYGWRIKVAAHLASRLTSHYKELATVAHGSFQKAITEISKKDYGGHLVRLNIAAKLDIPGQLIEETKENSGTEKRETQD